MGKVAGGGYRRRFKKGWHGFAVGIESHCVLRSKTVAVAQISHEGVGTPAEKEFDLRASEALRM